MKTLFIDFDGVLHPVDAAKLVNNDGQIEIGGNVFVYQDILLDLVRDIDVDIVVHSSWRNYHALSDILERWFYPELSAKVVGITPEMLGRAQSIVSYIDEHEIADFLIIDDCIDSFAYYKSRDLRSHLVLCDEFRGIADPAVQARIKHWLLS